MAFDLLNDLPMDDASGIEQIPCQYPARERMHAYSWPREGGSAVFEAALAEANLLTSDDRQKRIAEAQKELGFYFRNEGKWKKRTVLTAMRVMPSSKRCHPGTQTRTGGDGVDPYQLGLRQGTERKLP